MKYFVNTLAGLKVTSSIDGYTIVTDCTFDSLEATLCRDVLMGKYVHACEATYNNAMVLYFVFCCTRRVEICDALDLSEAMQEVDRVFRIAKAIGYIDHYCDAKSRKNLS